ncbi:helix-turn-helix domain-containing protein [Rubrobacter tropicus]|uniref:helix-turn-helix domain-containing protein n=1 Tax=Rubrobacter tropicus TaxID=2653851 RepID=UPI00140BD1CC|nr:helix-turn-helix domain-containing protein [Rubrobacter tropicus]
METRRHPDGGEWTGEKLARATGGVVTRSYVTNLRKGRIESPGYEKLKAIAKAMNFPPEQWFEEGNGARPERLEEAGTVTERVRHLFATMRSPSTGKPYTDSEVARASAGDLSKEDIEGIRTGRIADPTVGQVVALADAFGVDPSYLVGRKGPPSLDAELLEALGDETVRDVARDVSRLPDREKRMALGIVRQFGEGGSAG